MLLRDVLYKVAIRSVAGSTDTEVKDVQIDSRKVKPGGLFIAVRGTGADGHQFIDKALDNDIQLGDVTVHLAHLGNGQPIG